MYHSRRHVVTIWFHRWRCKDNDCHVSVCARRHKQRGVGPVIVGVAPEIFIKRLPCRHTVSTRSLGPTLLTHNGHQVYGSAVRQVWSWLRHAPLTEISSPGSWTERHRVTIYFVRTARYDALSQKNCADALLNSSDVRFVFPRTRPNRDVP